MSRRVRAAEAVKRAIKATLERPDVDAERQPGIVKVYDAQGQLIRCINPFTQQTVPPASFNRIRLVDRKSTT